MQQIKTRTRPGAFRRKMANWFAGAPGSLNSKEEYHNSNGKSMPIRLNGQIVGALNLETRTFYRRIRPEHILQRPNALAFHVELLDKLSSLGCEWIVCEMPDGRRIRTSLSRLLEKGFRFNRGFGEQVGLPLEQWTADEPSGQLSFWEMGVDK
ncbi:MAG: hypothetical protein QHI38_13645 [Armatimonadota bacterium]|nr:hypothetical protein [Armatimonadota bacterium]